jgi:putative transport protein
MRLQNGLSARPNDKMRTYSQVGMDSGPKFSAAAPETGLVMLGLGANVLVALVLPILTLGLLFLRMPFDEVAGIVAGACAIR